MQANNNPPSETKFTIVTTLLLFIIPLLSFIAFTVTPNDNRVINPFFVLLIFSFILFSISVAFTGLYSRLYTAKSDDIAILFLAIPFIPSFFFVSLLILAAFVLNEKISYLLIPIGIALLIVYAVALVIMTAKLLFQREHLSTKTEQINSID